MKKILIVVLVLLLAVVLPLTAFGEEVDTELEGYVTEIVEGGFLLEDKDLGTVMLNTSDATVWDGVLMESELEAGMYVIVQYDGRMTRSLPPQAHADKVGCYVLEGTVSEFLPTGVLLTGDPLFGDVIVQFEGDFPHVYLNVPITVYYDGVMALSLPGRVTAREIVVPQLSGTVSEKTEEGFLLTDADGNEYQVNLSEGTLFTETLPVQNEAETAEQPAEETAEEEASDAADEVDEQPLTEDEAIDVDAAETVLPSVDWADGDTVTVYYSGAMTRSLPPQLTALEVQVQR